jgi:hypothetical protein
MPRKTTYAGGLLRNLRNAPRRNDNILHGVAMR